MKITQIVATLDPGGTEHQLVRLVRGLDKSLFSPSVVCLTRSGPLQSDLSEAGIPVNVLGKEKKLDVLSLIQLVELLKKRRPSLVHTWLFTANAYGRTAALLAGVPTIIASERSTDPWKNSVHVGVDRFLAGFTDRLVSCCRAVDGVQDERTGLPPSRRDVIYSGIDVDRWADNPGSDLGSDPLLPQVPADAHLLGTAGRLEKAKNQEMLIKAVEKLVPKENIHLVLAGEGSREPILRSLADDLGVADRVHFPGHLEDLVQFMHTIDVFVLASAWEGLPNVLMEAMAAGCPVIATDVGGVGELVREGKTGRLVPPGDAKALANTISRSLSEREETREMVQEGRHLVEEMCGMDRMIREYQELYLTTIREQR